MPGVLSRRATTGSERRSRETPNWRLSTLLGSAAKTIQHSHADLMKAMVQVPIRSNNYHEWQAAVSCYFWTARGKHVRGEPPLLFFSPLARPSSKFPPLAQKYRRLLRKQSNSRPIKCLLPRWAISWDSHDEQRLNLLCIYMGISLVQHPCAHCHNKPNNLGEGNLNLSKREWLKGAPATIFSK